jgi:hypothetical protein
MRPVRNVFQKLSRTEQRREGVVAYLWYKMIKYRGPTALYLYSHTLILREYALSYNCHLHIIHILWYSDNSFIR